MAQVEDVSITTSSGVEHLYRLALQDFPRSDHRGRIQVALDRALASDPIPRGIQGRAPIDPDRIGTGLRHRAQQFARPHPEVDGRDVQIHEAGEQSGHVRLDAGPVSVGT